VIVVNDGCPETPLLKAALAPFEGRIHYLEQPTRGPSGARNAGILQARGKYVAFLDGDDYWCSDHLTKQMQLLRQDPSLDLVYCDTVLVRNEQPFDRAFTMEPQSANVTFDTLLTEDCAVSTSTAVVSREAIVRAGMFDENFRRCEDFDMWLRMSFGGARMTYHPDAQVYHRISQTGLSADRWAMKRDRIRVYQKMAALPVSSQQRKIIDRMVAMTETLCDVEQLKSALIAGDYALANEAAARASSHKTNWKFTLTVMGLRIAPRLSRRFHLARTRWQEGRRSARWSQSGLA